jgi:glycosyltransferase involved in cell wall biosynthesis
MRISDINPKVDLSQLRTSLTKELNRIDLGQPIKHDNFSVCMIVCNELENLKKYFNPAWPEICIVDTGSTDGTYQFLKQFPNVKIDSYEPIIYIEGRKYIDFSKARNRALSMATKDWILSLDADETITEKDRNYLYEITNIQHEFDAFYIRTWNFYKDPKDPTFNIKDKQCFNQGLVPRLWRNKCGVEYYGIVHERVDRSLMGLNYGAVTNWGIQHWGGLNKNKPLPQNNQKYRVMMEEQVRLDDSSWHYYLLSKWWYDKDINKAIVYAENAIKYLNPLYCRMDEEQVYKMYLNHLNNKKFTDGVDKIFKEKENADAIPAN